MTPERWQTIERLCHSALELKAGERAAYLQEACAGDDALQQEVESLLAQEKTAETFLESGAAERVARMRENMQATDGGGSMIGRRLGTYEVLSVLGVGGMGEVYEARDTKLGRNVAIK